MFKCGVYLVFFFVIMQSAKADVADTVIALEPVVTKGMRFEEYAVGAKIQVIDSFQLSFNQMNSVADLFAQQSLVNVTSYGPGGQAGVKIRGGGADHTTIIWNGLNLKPPMSGEINYSAINSGVFNQIKIQPGGSSTMYGSGAATGVVFLANKLKLEKKGFSAGVNSEAGSFSSYGLNTEGAYANEKFATRVFVGYQQAENNFQYNYGKKVKQQEHSAFNNISISQQNNFQLGSGTKIETDFWYTNLFKEVPSLTTDTEPGKTEQVDENLNFALNFTHYGSNWFIKYRGGVVSYNNSFLGYQDSAYYTAINKSQSYINEVETKYSFNQSQKLFLGVNSTLDRAQSDSYRNNTLRNNFDIFCRYSGMFFSSKLLISLEARQAFTDGDAIPIVYSTGFNFNILGGLSMKAAASKLYSLPDLNDLYWTETAWASGNPDLKPEYGWSAESGLRHVYTNSVVSLQHELTFYTSELKNAIVWLPDTTTKWVPINVEGTVTNGVEFIGQTKISYAQSILAFGYDYAFTDAKLSDSSKEEDNLVQRRYIPKHKAGIKIRYQFKSFSVAPYLQFVSERFIDDVSLPLDSYFLLDFYTSYKFILANSTLSVYVKLKNILDTDYQIMSGYAQPGRSVYIGINYKF